MLTLEDDECDDEDGDGCDDNSSSSEFGGSASSKSSLRSSTGTLSPSSLSFDELFSLEE